MDDEAWKSNWNESTLISRNEKIRNLFASHPECLIEVDIEDPDIVQILKKRTGWDLHDNASLEQNSIAQGTTVKPRCLLSPY